MQISDPQSLIDRLTENVWQELSRRGWAPPVEQSALPPRVEFPPAEMAKRIDHTLLKPDSTREQVVQLCREALQHGFAAVCVNPCWARLAADVLRGSEVKACSVVGFPLGSTPHDVKAYEARRAVLDGAREVDMVLNVGALKGGEVDAVERDIRSVVQVAEEYGAAVKVILETCLLSREEKVVACRISERAGAHFVKTSTGFSSGGATAADVRLMRDSVGDKVRVKASGGIKTYADAVAMIRAGASRIGTSSGPRIVVSP